MRSSSVARHLLKSCRAPQARDGGRLLRCNVIRSFHETGRVSKVKPFLLADIGEGIRECEVIQWFVEPEARVEEFDKICEVQSDKASVEIPSRFTGVVKRLHYDAGEMAIVGKPLIDIDVPDDGGEHTSATSTEDDHQTNTLTDTTSLPSPEPGGRTETHQSQTEVDRGTHAGLATPAVRHLSKELGVNISDVPGTGRDGRVSKDDIHKYVATRASPDEQPSGLSDTSRPTAYQTEHIQQLNPIQAQMFKTMTRSLNIPHFLYADEIDFTPLTTLREKINSSSTKSGAEEPLRISYMPFIIKAMSLALQQYPILNARVDTTGLKPSLVMRAQHNVGIAMDTPNGLIVPVIKNVATLSLLDIARELRRLQDLAAANRLSSAELSDGTISLSNIGVIGGTYLNPVIVDREVAILAMGRIQTIPAFGPHGEIVKKNVVNFSWCADHRVIDGATMARAAAIVKKFVEDPSLMLLHLS